MRPMPDLQQKSGVRVTDYTHLGPGEEAVFAEWDGEEIEAPIFNDILEARDGAKP